MINRGCYGGEKEHMHGPSQSNIPLKIIRYLRKFGFVHRRPQIIQQNWFTHWRPQLIIQQNSDSHTEDHKLFNKIRIHAMKTTNYSTKFWFTHWRPPAIQENSDSHTEDHKLFNKIRIHILKTTHYSTKFWSIHWRPQII